ncbi:MAG: hypothetical protein ACOYZ6_09980 [Chloroflexota bacterium]
MSKILLPLLLALCIVLSSCASPATATVTPTIVSSTDTATPLPPSDTPTPTDTATPVPPTATPLPTETVTPSPVPIVESLKAVVNTNLLSCRYGPGAEYLYLDGFLQGLNVRLVGWTGGSNWVWVKGDKRNCWVNAKFLDIEGDFKTLPVVYPDLAPLPESPYYSPSTVLSANRDGNKVTIIWLGVPVSPGDYEKPNMFIYVIEVWRCEGGQLIFDPLFANYETISFIDEPGCAQPSHGRVFVQEKHGYAGPAEIPWP